MRIWMQRPRRRYVILKTATAGVAISVYCAFAAQFVPAEPRLVNQDVVLAASIDTDNNAVGISDPYISAPYLQASTPAQLAAAKVKIDAEMAKMASLGVTNVRIQIDWPTVEKADGQFDWRALDQIVDSANAHNLGVLAVVSRTPSWAGGGILGNTPPDPAVYADFVGAVANRYSNRAAGTIGAYEIWNEPNGTFFYQSMDPTAYTAMLKAAYTAIKTADPQALVIAGAVGAGTTTPWGVNPVDFVKGMYDAGAKGFFDALSFHPYVYPLGTTWDVQAPYLNSAKAQLLAIRALMTLYTDLKPIWATEYGVPTTSGTTGPNGQPPVTQDMQAAAIKSFLDAWSALGFTGPMFLHSLTDLNSGTNDPEDNWGLFLSNGDPKKVVDVLIKWIQDHPTGLPPVDPGAGNPIGSVLQALSSLVQGVLQSVQSLLQGVGNVVTGLATAISQVFKAIGSIFNPTAANAVPAAALKSLASVSKLAADVQKVEEDVTKADEKVPADASGTKATEKVTEKAADKSTEKTTEPSDEKATEKATDKTTESSDVKTTEPAGDKTATGATGDKAAAGSPSESTESNTPAATETTQKRVRGKAGADKGKQDAVGAKSNGKKDRGNKAGAKNGSKAAGATGDAGDGDHAKTGSGATNAH